MSDTSKRSRSSQAPRWVHVALAIAALGTLAWAIVSRFLPSTPPAPKPENGSVNVVVGSGVGIGVNPGQVNVGVPPARPERAAPEAARNR